MDVGVPRRLDVDESTLTEAERHAFDLSASLANAMFALPVVHPNDNDETTRDIHNLQNRLLARAAYPHRPK